MIEKTDEEVIAFLQDKNYDDLYKLSGLIEVLINADELEKNLIDVFFDYLDFRKYC